MQLPKRIAQHITETSSYKIFSKAIPDHWIIRDLTERDYGIDCYIELVTNSNEVSGELISIQLKGREQINWHRDNTYTLSGLNISTTNYWRKFPVPVFICLVDIKTEQVYFNPVRSSIRKDYLTYIKQDVFTYKFQKEQKLSKGSLQDFLKTYFKEKQSDMLESHLFTFVSHYEQYQNFIDENTHRDQFMCVETSRILFLNHFCNNLQFLSHYFDLEWGIPKIAQYIKESQEMFGDNCDMYELQIHQAVTELQEKLIPVLLKLRNHVCEDEASYWIAKDIIMYNFMSNVRDDGSTPSW